MSRSTQSLVLLLVGLSVAVMLIKGTYLNYVKPGLLPWLTIAAALLIVLGVVAPALGLIIERVLMRDLAGADTGTTLVVTLGLLVLLIGVANA
nr:hypothetical protein [Actinomycetota bacterium]